MSFNGSAQYVTLGNFGLGSQTIAGWINSTNASGGSGGTSEVMIGTYGGSTHKYLGISLDGTALRWTIDDGITSFAVVGTVLAGAWSTGT